MDKSYPDSTKSIHNAMIYSSILARYVASRARVKSMSQALLTLFSRKCNVWSSRVYYEYKAITAHWVEEEWEVQSKILDFIRFKTSHCREPAILVLYAVILRWEIEKSAKYHY